MVKRKKSEGTSCVTFGFLESDEQEWMNSDQQAITKDYSDHDGKKYGAVDVSLLEGEIESKPAWAAATTVPKLEGT